jgi:hypothetical protein
MEERTHVNTLAWADHAERTGEPIYGITGRSIFFNIENFDVVKDMPPEPMHLMDAGFMKNTCLKIFNAGNSPQCKQGYRRTSITRMSNILRYYLIFLLFVT